MNLGCHENFHIDNFIFPGWDSPFQFLLSKASIYIASVGFVRSRANCAVQRTCPANSRAARLACCGWLFPITTKYDYATTGLASFPQQPASKLSSIWCDALFCDKWESFFQSFVPMFGRHVCTMYTTHIACNRSLSKITHHVSFVLSRIELPIVGCLNCL